MTSSTTRAFMAKKQSTSFTQVATNLLNVLQGYTKGIRFVAVLTILLTMGIGHLWAADVTWIINGVQTTADNTIVNTALKTSSVAPSSETGVWTAKSTKNSYAGSNSGAQLGAKNNKEFKGTITLSNTSIPASATITAITITGRSNGTYTISAKVGENSFGSAITFDSSANSEKSINGSIVGNSIVLTVSTSTASKYLGISKIVVSYTAATSYTVTYNANGGSGTMTQSTGSSITLKECTFTAPSGKEFDEWNTAANGSGISYQAGDIVDESLNLYAIWKELPKYTVTWDVNGDQSVTTQVTEGSKPTFPATPSSCDATSNTFYGWATDTWDGKINDVSAKIIYTSANDMPAVNGAVTYYAVFAEKSGFDGNIDFGGMWTDGTDLPLETPLIFNNSIYIEFAQNTGTDFPEYYDYGEGIRLYYANSMTISLTSGEQIQSITMYFSPEGDKGNSITANTGGTLQNGTVVTDYTWTINASSVTFTIGVNKDENASGHRKIQSIEVITTGGTVTYSNYTTSCNTTYTVTYNGNGNTGGTVPTDNNKYAENEEVTVLGNTGTLAKTGYTFSGWNTEANGNGTDYGADATFEITKNTILYAKWEANTYTVCFNANGGTGTMENQSFTYGAEQALSSNKFTRDSYIFAGWATTADGDVVYTDAQSVSNLTTTNGATVTLYAQWSELYTVTFYNMGSVYTTKTQESVGGSITFPEDPFACEGYTFDGWSATEVDGVTSYEAVTTITPNEDTQLYAVYSKTEDGGGNATVEDKLTRETTGVSDQTGKTVSYTDWSEIKSQSNAIYKGNSAGNYNSIQLRSDKSTSGVITTTSGGKAKKVTVEWNSHTANGRTLNVYGKNSAYSAASDLYNNSNRGDLLGTIVYETSTELTISGDYEYIGLRSAENAMYFTSITITWETSGGGSTTYTTDPSCVPTYTITWKNEDGTILETDENVENGATPSYDGEEPTKTATAQYTYTFDGWTPEIVKATQDAVYTATYTATVNTYTITWKNDDGTTLETDENVPYDETPTYNGATPAKAATAQYTYTFKGWTPDIVEATGDATYTATFTETLRTYTITWKNDDDTTLKTDENVPYGTIPSYDGEEPTKTATAQHSYDFNGWNPTITTVTGDATYTAKYTAIVNIIWMVNGKQKNSTTAPSGASVTPPDVNPIPCGAVLAGWTDAENGEYVHKTSTLYEGAKPSIKVTENKTFYAVFADYDEQQ